MSKNDFNITGHLTISKQYPSGEEEVVFDDHNIIVAGMGVGLSYLFAASGSTSILDYQIDRFQVGVSGSAAFELSSTQQLVGPLSSTVEYGSGANLYLQSTTQLVGASEVANRIFALIPAYKIPRIGETSVRYTFTLDEGAANNLTRVGQQINLNEVGLFMKNPTGGAINKSILVAYRYFSNIYKTSDFSLVFRWTIHF
jgi:hypothetical protein